MTHDQLAAAVAETCRAILKSAPSWQEFFDKDGATLDAQQCAAASLYFARLRLIAQGLLDRAQATTSSPPDNVLPFRRKGTATYPHTPVNGGGAA